MTNNPSSGSKSSSSSPYHEASDLLNRILSSSSTSIQVHNHNDNQNEQEQQEQQRAISKMMNQLKRFVLHKKHHTLQVSTKTYAIVANVIQNLYMINAILYHTNIPQLQIYQSNNHNKKNSTKNTNTSNTNTNIKNIGLYYILLYELLLSKQQRMIGGGTIKRFIIQYESILRQTMKENYHHINNHNHVTTTTTLPSSSLATTNSTTNPTTISFPRYIRINTCVTTVSNFIQQYNNFIIQQQEQYEQEHEHKKKISNNNNNNTLTLNHNVLYKDEHIPNLFIVSPKIISKLLHYFNTTNNHNNNCFILQDKSSCIPAFCLYSLLLIKQENTSYGDIIDACAAPGNKTSHIASLLVQQEQQEEQQQQQEPSTSPSSNTKTKTKTMPTIYAFDRDQSRYKTLHQRMEELVPSTITISSFESEQQKQPTSSSTSTTTINNCNIIVQHLDFLTINGDMYPTVTCIVLDPSCSGSGLYNRNHSTRGSNSSNNADSYDPISDINDDNTNKDIYDTKFLDRIQKLSGFQITCLRHAMTHFPNVHTIIYSTCSIYIYENEYVIGSVFNDTNNITKNTSSNNDNDTTTINTMTTDNLQNEWNVVAPPDLQSWKRRGCSKYVLDSNNSNNKVDHSINDLQEKKDSTKNSSHNEFIHSVQTTIQNNLTMNDINCFIRTNYNDRTNGFFVACLQRKNNIINNNTMSLSNTATSKTKKRKASSTMNDTSMNVQHDATLQFENNDLYNNIPIYNGEFDNYNNNDNDYKKNDRVDATTENTTIATNDISKSNMINNNNHDTKSTTYHNRSKRKHSVVQVNDADDDDTKTNSNSKRKVPSDKNNKNNNMKQPIQSTSKDRDIISTTTTTSNNNNVSNKKRNKKLQWKQRQHAAKVARTKTTQKPTTVVKNKNNAVL